MFRIDRQYLGARLRSRGRHQLTGDHQGLFIGKGDTLSGLDRAERRHKPDRPDRRRNDRFGLGVLGYGYKAFFAAFDSRGFYIQGMQFALEFFGAGFIPTSYKVGTKFRYLRGKRFYISPRAERDDAEVPQMFNYF
jgi:hypothetical protein